jgi:glyoxylase-like metal-dependent hydrolase (beta-lactamase superfamily II)
MRKTNKSGCIAVALFALTITAPSLRAQASNSNVRPDWCKSLPRPQYKTLERVPSADPWFEVYKVAPGVFAIYEPHQFEEVISFLILGDRRAVLFDTGLGIGDIKRVVSALTPLPITVLNSHTHNDHVGDNWEFDEIYGMDTEFTRTNAKGSIADAQDELAPGSVCGPLPAGFDAKSYATRPFHITRVIHDGDTVDLGGRMLQIIATPGHTPDEICLLDQKNGLLFTGDNFYPGPIWLYRPETDLDAYVQSITRIAALAPQLHLLLPSHNVPVADPSQLPKLLTAIERVRGEAVEPFAAGNGKVTYTVNGFIFLMAAPN